MESEYKILRNKYEYFQYHIKLTDFRTSPYMESMFGTLLNEWYHREVEKLKQKYSWNSDNDQTV
jgi:hypothetical protein